MRRCWSRGIPSLSWTCLFQLRDRHFSCHLHGEALAGQRCNGCDDQAICPAPFAFCHLQYQCFVFLQIGDSEDRFSALRSSTEHQQQELGIAGTYGRKKEVPRHIHSADQRGARWCHHVLIQNFGRSTVRSPLPVPCS